MLLCISFLNFVRGDQTCEVFIRAIIGAFHVIREKTGRQFPASAVVYQTITTGTFAGTGSVGAVTHCHIFFLFTFHNDTSISAIMYTGKSFIGVRIQYAVI